jgi:hypothetical protein
MQNAGNDKQMHKQLGVSWNDSGGLLSNVLLQSAHNKAHSEDKEKMCITSRLGCPICKEPIYKECWREGYDKHALINVA